MRRILAAVALALVAVPALGQIVRFHPAAPTSRTAVSVTISGLWGDGCPPRSAKATVSGNRISVELAVFQIPCQIALVRPVEYRVTAFIGLLGPGVYQMEATVPGATYGTIASATIVVREAEPALTVVPPVIFTNSGTVRIRAVGMGTCPPNVSPCRQPRVFVSFNGNLSPLGRIISPDEIEATVPLLPNPVAVPGNVYNIVVTTDDGRRREARSALFIASPDGLYDPAVFERVLIPVIFSGPGAFGSEWTTDVVIENPGGDDVPVFRTPINLRFSCGIPEGCPLESVPARGIVAVHPQWPTGLFVHAARGNDLRYNVLIRDLSRQRKAIGTELPVVREDDWYDDRLNLLNVPSDARFRVALRVYLEDDSSFFGAVPVRIFRMDTDAKLVDSFLPLDAAHNGQIPGTGWIADLSSNFAIPPGGPLRIEIASPMSGERFWAFASITNNATQHVTVISPQ